MTMVKWIMRHYGVTIAVTVFLVVALHLHGLRVTSAIDKHTAAIDSYARVAQKAIDSNHQLADKLSQTNGYLQDGSALGKTLLELSITNQELLLQIMHLLVTPLEKRELPDEVENLGTGPRSILRATRL